MRSSPGSIRGYAASVDWRTERLRYLLGCCKNVETWQELEGYGQIVLHQKYKGMRNVARSQHALTLKKDDYHLLKFNKNEDKYCRKAPLPYTLSPPFLQSSSLRALYYERAPMQQDH